MNPGDWLWGVGSVGMIVGGISLGAAFLMRRYSAAARQQVWIACLTLMTALPIGVGWNLMTPRNLPTANVPSTPDPRSEHPSRPGSDRSPEAGPAETATPAPVAAAPLPNWIPADPATLEGSWTPKRSGPRPALLLFGIWLIPFGVLLTRLALGVIGSEFRVYTSKPVDDDEWCRNLDEACRKVGLKRAPDLKICPAVSSPVTAGLFRPTILLPGDSTLRSGRPGDRRGGPYSSVGIRIVLLHECAHVARRDLALKVLGRFAVAVHWFNPVVWFAARRLEALGERASDDHVLAAGIRPSVYIRQLRIIAEAAGSVGFVPQVGFRSSLHQRIDALANASLPRRTPGRWGRLFILLAPCFLAPLITRDTPTLPVWAGGDAVFVFSSENTFVSVVGDRYRFEPDR